MKITVSRRVRELLDKLCDLEAELGEEKPDPIDELESMLEHEVENARESLEADRREKRGER